mgnify:CR=1 FL=1
MAAKNIELFGMNNKVTTLTEENKLLKKAVAIQESRQRNLSNHNQQLELTISQAVQHISNLDRVIKTLRSRLLNEEVISGLDFGLDKPPPDVY